MLVLTRCSRSHSSSRFRRTECWETFTKNLFKLALIRIQYFFKQKADEENKPHNLEDRQSCKNCLRIVWDKLGEVKNWGQLFSHMKYLFRLDQVTRLNFFHQSDHSGNQQPPRPGGEIFFPTGNQVKTFFTILLRWEKLSYFWFGVSPFWMLNPDWIRAWNFRLKSVLRQVLAGSVNMGRWKERDGTDWSIRTW